MSNPSGERISLLVRAERVRALFARSVSAQAAVLVNSAVMVLVLWGRAERVRLVAWLVLLWLAAAGRLIMVYAYRRSNDAPERAGRWELFFTIGSAVNGLLWGSSPLLFRQEITMPYVAFLAFVLAGMSAGSAVSNASHLPAFLAYMVPALLPYVTFLFAEGDEIHLGMGAMLAVFGLVVTVLARTSSRTMAEAARLRFHNADLVEHLARAAQELEARVAERSTQLAAALSREREAEHELGRAARLASLGTLAAGVAHEINGPLTYLRSNLKFVREELTQETSQAAERTSMLEALADAADGVERVRAIVRRLTDISRVELGAGAVPIDLHATLELCASMAAPEVQSRARLTREYGEVPKIMGERTQLVQVFLNLLLNAAQAIPEGDPLRHSIRLATRLEPEVGQVAVEITDTGCGIPESSRERIWEPFYTTKPLGQGVGLGLPICKSIVRNLGGSIELCSREGAGSTFTVRLRAATEVESSAASTA
jgi:signal transduction histidine kinase